VPGWYWHRQWYTDGSPHRWETNVVHVSVGYGLYLPGTKTPEEFLQVGLSGAGLYGPETHDYRLTTHHRNGVEWAGPIEPPAQPVAPPGEAAP
jgi:hypothetical protein